MDGWTVVLFVREHMQLCLQSLISDLAFRAEQGSQPATPLFILLFHPINYLLSSFTVSLSVLLHDIETVFLSSSLSLLSVSSAQTVHPIAHLHGNMVMFKVGLSGFSQLNPHRFTVWSGSQLTTHYAGEIRRAGVSSKISLLCNLSIHLF